MQYIVEEYYTENDSNRYVPKYREDYLSEYKVFFNPDYRVGYVHFPSLFSAQEFIDRISKTTIKKTYIYTPKE